MASDAPRTLLIATDLTAACDVVIRAAGALALQTGADLHVVHVVEGAAAGSGDAATGRYAAAEEALAEQLARSLPAGVEPASREVRTGPVHPAIRTRAEETTADLLVFGPHGGSAVGAHFLGSTADRLLRTSRIPCLVVRGDLRLPLRRVGVPIDLEDPSREALHLAFRWTLGLTSGRQEADPPVRLVYVGWPVTQVDLPDYEESTLRPRLGEEIESAAAATGVSLAAEGDVLWDDLPGQRLCRWAHSREVDLLVVGTHGRSGLPRAFLGSMATRLAREAPCSVLLVPPAAMPGSRRGTAPALDRVMLATDFSLGSFEAGSWVAEHLAPEAELVLAHAVDVPYPPSFLSRGVPPRDELTKTAVAGAERRLEDVARALPRAPRELAARVGHAAEALSDLARETGVDLMAVGAHGRREGLWADLGSTAERLLAVSPVPVLVCRGFEEEPPRRLLVPIDDSADARHALAWAAFLAERLGADLVMLHVVSSALLGALRRVSSGPAAAELDHRLRSSVERWLGRLATETELPPERITHLVENGVPELQILASAARLDCDLIVMGSRGSGGATSWGSGACASAVVHHTAVPVLVVPPPRP
jgi:nucleotide-binding universal stress UspA family protein